MAFFKPVTVTPRPAPPIIPEQTWWERFVDKLLHRSDLQQQLNASRQEIYSIYREIEAMGNRRKAGASAAHEDMFKIEDLGVGSSEVTVTQDHRRIERTAKVEVRFLEVSRLNAVLNRYLYERETVSFEGLTYVIEGVEGFDGAYGYADNSRIWLKLTGVVVNEKG